MRLIDADSLLYEDITDEHGNTYMVVHASQVDSAPTIDPSKELLDKINKLEQHLLSHPRAFEVSDVFELIRESLVKKDAINKDNISVNLKIHLASRKKNDNLPDPYVDKSVRCKNGTELASLLTELEQQGYTWRDGSLPTSNIDAFWKTIHINNDKIISKSNLAGKISYSELVNSKEQCEIIEERE